MVAYIELSAKDINHFQLLESTFATLGRHMVKCREESERTRISRATLETIALQTIEPANHEITRSGSNSDEWEVLSIPDGPVPDYVVSGQEQRRLKKYHQCSC